MQNLPMRLAEAVAEKIENWGLIPWGAKTPIACLLPEYDTTRERGLKIAVIPSNITTDSRVARGVIKQIFATQVTIMKYLPDGDANEANDALNLAERLTALFSGEDIYVDGIRFSVSAVVMFGASEVLWNGDYQIDGLLKQETLAPADVFSSSFVVIATRYIVR